MGGFYFFTFFISFSYTGLFPYALPVLCHFIANLLYVLVTYSGYYVTQDYVIFTLGLLGHDAVLGFGYDFSDPSHIDDVICATFERKCPHLWCD